MSIGSTHLDTHPSLVVNTKLLSPINVSWQKIVEKHYSKGLLVNSAKQWIKQTFKHHV
jgi:hypothetical protein